VLDSSYEVEVLSFAPLSVVFPLLAETVVLPPLVPVDVDDSEDPEEVLVPSVVVRLVDDDVVVAPVLEPSAIAFSTGSKQPLRTMIAPYKPRDAERARMRGV